MATSSAHLSLLGNFLQIHLPHIRLVTPASPEYPSFRSSFCSSNSSVPLAIVRPQSIADVSSLISFTTVHEIPVTVRSGGYSYFGSAFSYSALAIDLRSLSSIQISSSGTFATIGGGVIQGDLARELGKIGLMTPVAGVSSMGYVGWATYGGYGPFSGAYGLGVDQIVGVRLVDSDGQVKDSDDEGEEGLLRAIRGGGGALGVIVELRIKVYPLKMILAGDIIFSSNDISRTVQMFNNRYRELTEQGLPLQLSLKQMAFPSSRDKVFGVQFMWASEDISTGQQYLATIEALAPISRNDVKFTTVSEWMENNTRLPSNGYGYPRTLSVRAITPEIIAIVSKYSKWIPEDCLGFSLHELRGRSAQPDLTSVFGPREPHFMFEIMSIASHAHDVEESKSWADNFLNELRQTNPNGILEGTYLPLTRSGEVPLSQIYGPNYGNLLELKWMYDPNDVFCLAIPQLIDRSV